MAKKVQNFNAEIKQLLDIVIHSLYSNKEIFLRELISNASDALDKLRFAHLTDAQLKVNQDDLKIQLVPNKEQKTLQIKDNGIGMSPEEVTEFIGTIAKSGTKAFSQLKSADLQSRPELIGQFGVGFYSAFMVADKVTLHTQKAGTQTATLWESTGDGSYTIDEIPKADGVGTTITLHLKQLDTEDEKSQDFSEEWTLKSLVKKYSDFITYPIKMNVKKLKEQESDDTKEESTEENKTKEPTYEITEETLNSMKALWLRSPQEIKPEEYKEFYQHLTHDWSEPVKHIHYKAEGTIEFTGLFYLPGKKPWNYQMKDYEYGLSLYIKRVFIMDHCKDLLPAWLRFVKGMVDSSDLSLNVSRELLQQDRQVTQIRKNVVNKVLSTLKEMLNKEKEQYVQFYKEFGTTLKEGIPMDQSYKEKISELLMFKSTVGEDLVTLEEYISRMKEGQKDIYYITGERLEAIKNSPYLEKLNEKGFEVLFLTDAVDEWVTQDLTEYKTKKLVSITKEGLDLDTEEEKKKKAEEQKSLQERFKPLVENMKSHLSEQVKDVRFSDRLTKTPVCLVSEANAMSAQMEQLMARMGGDMPMQAKSKRILEINAKHPLFNTMIGLSGEQQKTWSEILYNQALITEGSPLPDPVRFSNLIADLMLN